MNNTDLSVQSTKLSLLRQTPPSSPFRLSTTITRMKQDQFLRRAVLAGIVVCIITIITITCLYLNYPQPVRDADTGSYFPSVQQLQQYWNPVHPWRLPGYPLLIVLVYALAGQNNLMAVSCVQAALFVLSVLEIYAIAILLLKRVWIACVVSLLLGTNVLLLCYVRAIMSEGLALWLLTTLALLMMGYLRTKRLRYFWLTMLLHLLLLFTRPEWVLLPVITCVFLFAIEKRTHWRRLFWHSVLALSMIYLLVGGYIAINATQNHYTGLSFVTNMNLMGKILQYGMQDEAPPEYTKEVQVIDSFIRHGNRDPYQILAVIPSLGNNHAAGAATMSITIMLHHPLEFLWKSVPYLFSTLTVYYHSNKDPVVGAPFYPFLSLLHTFNRVFYNTNALFPLCGLFRMVLLFRRTRHSLQVLGMAFVVLIVAYGDIITTLAGYFDWDYIRFHTVFTPLMMLTIWGTLLLAALYAGKQTKMWIRRRFSSNQDSAVEVI